jgi:hypothetical protein
MKGTEVVGVLQYIKVTVQRKGWVVGGRFDRAIHPSAKESESYSSIISHSDEEKPLNFKVKKICRTEAPLVHARMCFAARIAVSEN